MKDVFLSVGRRLRPDQEEFVRSLEEELRRNDVSPKTVGRNDFTSGQPLARIAEVMAKCCGAVVIAFERTHSPTVVEYRRTPEEHTSHEITLPTVWNQIEASMAYVHGLPLLVVVERGLRPEGLLEARYDWYVQTVDPSDEESLTTPEFRGVLTDWLKRVDETSKAGPARAVGSNRNVEALTPAQLVRSLSIKQAWAIIVAIATTLAGIAAIAYTIGQAAGAS
jgi:hypothetical protein